MGFFFDRFKAGSRIPPNAAFKLTQEGREKLQEFCGDAKSRILLALETRGTSDVREIAQSAGLTVGQVEHLLPSLLAKGYVQYVTSGMSVEE